jgi:hypothetical protein
MSFTKTIIGLALSLLLASGTASADWGDVYYCQMTKYTTTNLEGEQINHPLGKFQFKLDQTKNAMVMGSTGNLKHEVFELTTGRNWPSQEFWYANALDSMIFFRSGKFMYSYNGFSAIVVSADCDKF